MLLLTVALLTVTAAPLAAQEGMGLPDFIAHTECEVDLTGQVIPFIHFGDLSGSYAFITQPFLAGFSNAIEYYNAHGGVCGATFRSELGTDYRDTGGRPEDAQAAYDYFSNLDPKPDLLVLYASGDAERFRDAVAEDEIPVLISAGSVPGLYGEDGQAPGWIYATNPLYTDQLGSFCQFVAANPDRFPDPVIGYMGWGGPVEAFGKAAFTDQTRAYCESVGAPVLETPELFLPLPTADVTGNVQNLVDSGANILYVNALAFGPYLVAKTVIDLGLEDSVQVGGVNWIMDTSVGLLGQQTLGSDGLPSVNGLIGSLPFRWWSERDLPAVQFLNEQYDANIGQFTDPVAAISNRNIAYLLGWGTIDTYTELYIQTVNRVGSLDAIAGADMRETIETMVYSPLGGLYNFDFKGGSIRALPDNRIAEMRFLNATGDGPATSAEDAFRTETGGFIPILIPLTEFAPAPDLRPGGADVPG
jgi:ABC-type branched-subunit amino acid transport system substrate-binding protein